MIRSLARFKGNICWLKRSVTPASNYSTSKNDGDNPDDQGKKEPEDFWNTPVPEENPLSRTFRTLEKQMREIRNNVLFWKNPKPVDVDEWGVDSTSYPSHVDVVIVGGGIMGSSIAYWLKKIGGDDMRVVVVEKDPTYKQASTVLSAGGIRQQFSLVENIEMSLYGAHFLRNINEYLGIDGEPPIDVNYCPQGYLFLAREEAAELLRLNSTLQNSTGADNVLLTPKMLKEKFPWLNTDGVALGCLGLSNEGWFDPWSLLMAFKKKAIAMGAEYVTADAKNFLFRKDSNIGFMEPEVEKYYRRLTHIVVKSQTGEKKVIQFALCVIAAGAFSGEIAKLSKVGTNYGVLSVPLPVEPRKRYVYCVHAPDGPGLNTPLTVDTSGFYFRREGLGNHYIVGRSPTCDEEEPPVNNLKVDESYFYDSIWPDMCKRVPAFEKLKLVSSWAGYYDYNRYDQNGIVGNHPHYNNLFFATGFSGHGIQQAPAVGRAISELVKYSGYRTIDLTRLGFERFVTQEPVLEQHLV